MLAGLALAAGVLGGGWWLARGARRARRLYRCWRRRNAIVVYGFREHGRAWQLDAALVAVLAIVAGPLLPDDIDAGRCWRVAGLLAAIIWLAAGVPLDRVWR